MFLLHFAVFLRITDSRFDLLAFQNRMRVCSVEAIEHPSEPAEAEVNEDPKVLVEKEFPGTTWSSVAITADLRGVIGCAAGAHAGGKLVREGIAFHIYQQLCDSAIPGPMSPQRCRIVLSIRPRFHSAWNSGEEDEHTHRNRPTETRHPKTLSPKRVICTAFDQ